MPDARKSSHNDGRKYKHFHLGLKNTITTIDPATIKATMPTTAKNTSFIAEKYGVDPIEFNIYFVNAVS